MHGAYNAHEAAMDHALHMLGLKTDSMLELTYAERKRVHNLKYYTWVEQQGMTVEDLNAQWYDTKGTWDAVHAQAKELDELINEFNEATGLLKSSVKNRFPITPQGGTLPRPQCYAVHQPQSRPVGGDECFISPGIYPPASE